MVKRALLVSCIATLAATGPQPAAAAPWVRGYVVGVYSYAFRYAGRDDYARGKDIEPGVDCPHGNTVAFDNTESAADKLSYVTWRLKKDNQELIDAQINGSGDRNSPLWFFGIWVRASAFRGYRGDIETYVNPFAADDPGEPEVSSRIGEGFNLDGKIKPTDFVSPDGEKGIDNNLYRAWGCDAPWRGDGNATLDLRANDKMQDGLYTIVVRVSGNKDPMNDDNATLEIGYSPDHLMKDASGATGMDYSYRILKSALYTKLKAKVKDGVIESEQADIHMPQIAWFPNQNRDADFQQGKIRIVTNPDGTAAGLVGGYRNWRDLYAENTFAQDGGQQGVREHEDMVSLYYALRRNADGLRNPRTGRYDGISTAYRMKLAQAYVVDPQKPMDMPVADVSDQRGIKAYDATVAALHKGLDTLKPQPVPAASNEPPDISKPYGHQQIKPTKEASLN